MYVSTGSDLERCVVFPDLNSIGTAILCLRNCDSSKNFASNLCVEVVELTPHDSQQIISIAAIALNRFALRHDDQGVGLFFSSEVSTTSRRDGWPVRV